MKKGPGPKPREVITPTGSKYPVRAPHRLFRDLFRTKYCHFSPLVLTFKSIPKELCVMSPESFCYLTYRSAGGF